MDRGIFYKICAGALARGKPTIFAPPPGHTTNLAVVAPGIAQALLATAFGLVAAIPAVVIYNVLARQTAHYRAYLGDASVQVMRLVSRDLDRPKLPMTQAAE
jgi:biopolymer transport protein ExbB